MNTTPQESATGAAAKATSPGAGSAEHQQPNGHDSHNVTIPVDRIAGTVGKAVTLPVTAAQRILPAKGGLPLYAGLGVLGAVGVLEWPVAAGIGVGYAILRRGGALKPAGAPPQAQTPPAGEPAATPQAQAPSTGEPAGAPPRTQTPPAGEPAHVAPPRTQTPQTQTPQAGAPASAAP